MKHGLLCVCADCAAVRDALRGAAEAAIRRNDIVIHEGAWPHRREEAVAENERLVEGLRLLGIATASPEEAVSRVRRIIAEAAADAKITVTRLLGPSRKRAVVHARDRAIFRAKEETTLPLTRLGALFGGRDHSTIHSALARERQRRSVDEAVEAVEAVDEAVVEAV